MELESRASGTLSDLEERLMGLCCPYPDCLYRAKMTDEAKLLPGESELLPGQSEPKRLPSICPACARPFTRRSLVHGQEMVKKVRQFDRLPRQIKEPRPTSEFVVVLEDLRSLHNVGAIFRTADGAGFGKIICCGITAVPPRPQIAKVSLGAEDFVEYQFYPLITEAIYALKKDNYAIVALEKNQSSCSLYSALKDGAIKKPLALILGNEVAGVSAEALHLSDAVCHLSMRGQKESLNVSVAFGAASYLIAELLA